jgi:peptidoglycan hydrolase-like protein with peptidoglycan-binding domain
MANQDRLPIREGDRGEGVIEVQRTLNAANWLEVDGEYGDATRFAVMSFQIARGLPGTGEVDQDTQNALEEERRRAAAVARNAP